MATNVPTGVVPAPQIRKASAFPVRADRQNRTYNTKAEGWATSAAVMAGDMDATAAATESNATWAQMQSVAAEQTRMQTAAVKEAAALETGAIRDQARDARDAAKGHAAAAAATASFKGAWSALAGPLSTPATVFHSGMWWALLANVANVAMAEPGVSSSWAPAGVRIPYVRYEQRGQLRTLAGPGLEHALVDGLGLFRYTSSAEERAVARSSVINNDDSWPNLLPNGDFSAGLQGWTSSVLALGNHPTWGAQVVASGFSGTTTAVSAVLPVTAGQTYIVSGDSLFLNATQGSVYIDMLFSDANGAILLDGYQSPISESHDFSIDNRWRAAIAAEYVVPVGAVSAVVRLVADGVVGPAIVGFRKIKLVMVPGDSAGPDDDESCFVTQEGAWLLQCPSMDAVACWLQPWLLEARARLDELEAISVRRGSAVGSITSVAAGAQASFAVAVSGAVVGQAVAASPGAALPAQVAVFARVTAAGIVTVYINNPSSSTATLAASTWAIAVF